MKKLEKGRRVGVIVDSRFERGTLTSMIEELNIGIVKLDNGEMLKVNLSTVAIDDTPKEDPNVKESEPVEKSEITITPNDFMKTSTKVIADKCKCFDSITTLFITSVIAEIHRRLFYEDLDND